MGSMGYGTYFLLLSVLVIFLLSHTVNGGTSGTLSQNQDKVASLLTNVPLKTREGLRAFYERDFVLFDYVYEVASNRIY